MDIIIEKFIEYLQNEKNKSLNTVSAYKSDIEKLVKYLNNNGVYDLDKVTYTDLNSYILYLEKNNSASSSISRCTSSVKTFFEWLFYNRLIVKNPALEIKAPRVRKKIPEILSIGEMTMLVENPDLTTRKGVRDRAILELMYATGIKTTQLIDLRIKDINMVLKTVQISDNGYYRRVMFSNIAREYISKYLSEVRASLSDKTDYLFVNMNGDKLTRQGLWKVIKEYGEKTGLDDRLTPNTIRHSFAAHLVSNGADLRTIQDILGYTDSSAAQIYLAFSNKKVNIVYEQSHPRK